MRYGISQRCLIAVWLAAFYQCIFLTGSEFGLHSLPKEVLLKILGMAALPLGTWMTGLPQIKSTEGLPEKPLPLETLKQHQHARNN